LRFSENIKNFFLLILIVGLSMTFIAIIGLTDFARQIELITFTPYAEKTTLMVLFTAGLVGNYVSLYKLWKKPYSKSNSSFAVGYSFLLIVTSALLLVWIIDMESMLNLSFSKKKFPNDVDEIIFSLRASFLQSIFWIFFLLGLTGVVSLSGILFLQKSLFKRFF
tara:strand:+ start:584 stop:1078 length:495 start_codon:yes stop_codon:yes gene_type:complete